MLNVLLNFLYLCFYSLTTEKSIVYASSQNVFTKNKDLFDTCVSNDKNLNKPNETAENNQSPSAPEILRIEGICQTFDNQQYVAAILEMEAYLTIFYTTTKLERSCQLFQIAYNSNSKQLWMQKTRSSFMHFNDISSSNSPSMNEANNSTSYLKTINAIMRTSECTNLSRVLRISFDSTPFGLNASKPWTLELTWERQPEYYEVGEVGWSSVGAHLGVLSGIFSLSNIQLYSYLESNNLFSNAHPSILNRLLVVNSFDESRFRARAGDHYRCDSEHHILLNTVGGQINFTKNETNDKNTARLLNRVEFILTTRHLRSQAFSDFGTNQFTGTAMTCNEDIHEDHTITITIGVAIGIIVCLAIIYVVLTRLYDMDKAYENFETSVVTSKEHTISNC